MPIPNAVSVDGNIEGLCHPAWTETLSPSNYVNATIATLGDSPRNALPTVLYEKPILNLAFTCF